MTRVWRYFWIGIWVSVVALVQLPAQQRNLEVIAARDELRWGVSAFHDGNFNESILSLTRSIAFDSTQELARYWLGRAYYSAGYEEAALTEWYWLDERGAGSAVLSSWLERVETQRGLTEERLGDELTPGRLVTMAEIEGIQGDLVAFRRPAMVRPRSDGYFYVASFGTHQVLLMDPNGVRKKVIDGGLEGFDRPFDIVLLDSGELLISEFGSDRIARVSGDGFKIGSFGSTGRGEGELLGPQFLTADDDGFIYVSDYGNRRVAKFRTDGDFILTFGSETRDFEGLREPTGLAWHSDRIYVADAVLGRIVVFDESGNYLGSLADSRLDRPEALSVYRDNILLVADHSRLYALRIDTGRLDLLADLSERNRLIGSVVDANQNVIVSDFQSDRLLVMVPSEELYTGLTVEVEQVIAEDHPNVAVAVHVSDRNRNPVLGLAAENFRITEDRFPTGQASMAVAGYQTQELALAVIADRAFGMLDHEDAVETASLELVDRNATGKNWLVTAGEQPLVEATPEDGRLSFAAAAVGVADAYGRSAIDLAIRLAGGQVVREVDRRAVCIISDGEIGPGSFDRYGLIETGDFLRNNHIAFNVVYTERNAASAELDYLVETTGGRSAYLYQPEGLGGMVTDLRSRPSGTYVLQFSSVHDSDFGRRYIPLEVEVYLLRRSGRDVAGYYGPLEF